MSSFDPCDRARSCEQCESAPVGYCSRSLCGTCHVQSLIDDGEHDTAYAAAADEGISPMVVLGMIQAAARYARRAREINEMHRAIRDMDATRVVLRAPAAANDNASVRVMS